MNAIGRGAQQFLVAGLLFMPGRLESAVRIQYQDDRTCQQYQGDPRIDDGRSLPLDEHPLQADARHHVKREACQTPIAVDSLHPIDHADSRIGPRLRLGFDHRPECFGLDALPDLFRYLGRPSNEYEIRIEKDDRVVAAQGEPLECSGQPGARYRALDHPPETAEPVMDTATGDQ